MSDEELAAVLAALAARVAALEREVAAMRGVGVVRRERKPDKVGQL